MRDEYGRFQSEDDSERGWARPLLVAASIATSYGRFQATTTTIAAAAVRRSNAIGDERGRFASDEDDDRGGRGRSSSQQRDPR
jgi:hypothetical protein